MRVMVIVKATKASEAGEMPSEKLLAEMGAYNQQLIDAGIMTAGEGLQPSSKGARVTFDGKQRTVTDGPFAETKELIAGFWMWKVKSLEEAIEWVKKCPNPHEDVCDIEIRPVFEADDFGETFTPELREQEASQRAQTLGLGAIRYENGPELSLSGLSERYTTETRQNIPQQWQKFTAYLDKVPGQVGNNSYGVVYGNQGCDFDYLTGVEVRGNAKLPAEFKTLKVPASRYAVFTNCPDAQSIPGTLAKIWGQWAPNCGLKLAKAPCFERYTKEFDRQTHQGGIEFWIPLEA